MKLGKQQDNILTSISKLKMKLKSDKFELECIKNDFGKVRMSTIIQNNNNQESEKQNLEFRSNAAEKYDIIISKQNGQINELIKSHKIQIKNIVQKYQKMLNQQNQMHLTQIQQLKSSYQIILHQKNLYIDKLKQTLNNQQQTNNNSIKQLKQNYQAEYSKMKQNYQQIINNLNESLNQKKIKEYTFKNYQQLNESQISTDRLNYSERDRTINRIQNQSDSDIFCSNATARQSLMMSISNKPQPFSKNNQNKNFSKIFKTKLKFKKQSTNDIGNIEIPSSYCSIIKQPFAGNKIIYKSSVNLCQQYLATVGQQDKSKSYLYKKQDETKNKLKDFQNTLIN